MTDSTPHKHIEGHVGDHSTGIAIGENITQVNIYTANQPDEELFDIIESEKRYCGQVIKHWEHVEYFGKPDSRPPVPLRSTFIPLNLEITQASGDNIDLQQQIEKIEQELEQKKQWGEQADQRLIVELERELSSLYGRAKQPRTITLPMTKALDQYKRLFINGEAGSGKTTLTRWLAVTFAQQILTTSEPSNEHLVPILLELSSFAELVQQPGPQRLVNIIADFLKNNGRYGQPPIQYTKSLLSQGRCLLLFDGFDEISGDKARNKFIEAINSLYQEPDNRYHDNYCVITSRSQSLQPFREFQKCTVNAFDTDDIQLFIEYYCTAVNGTGGQNSAKEIVDAIYTNHRTADLIKNPLLCRLFVRTYNKNNRNVVLDSRIKLYEEFCKGLFEQWKEKGIRTSTRLDHQNWEINLSLLEPLAYWLHGATGQLTATEAELVTQLTLLSQENISTQEANRIITAMYDRVGLLRKRNDELLEFVHLSFQEYLCARYIVRKDYPDYIDLVMEHLHEAWWQEVHLLVIECFVSRDRTDGKLSKLVEQLAAYYRPPWPLLRSFSISASVPDWLLEINKKSKNNHLSRLFGQVVCVIILMPQFFSCYLARLLPRWQLAQRLAWMLQRETKLVAQGYFNAGAPSALSKAEIQLDHMVTDTVLRYIYDGDKATLQEPSFQPLIYLCKQYSADLFATAWTKEFGSAHHSAKLIEPRKQARLVEENRDDTPTIEAQDEIINSIVDTLSHATSYREQEAAVQQLSQFDNLPANAVEALLKAMRAGKWYVRRAAVKALKGVEQTNFSIVKALVTALSDWDLFVSIDASGKLMQIHERDPKAVVQVLLEELNMLDRDGRNSRSHSFVYRNNVRFYRNNIPFLSSKIISIFAMVYSVFTTPLVVLQAIMSGKLRQRNFVTSTKRFGYPSGFHDLRYRDAVKFAGQLGGKHPGIIEVLLKALTYQNEDVRGSAARTLGRIGECNSVIIDALIRSLSDSHSFVRASASYALGNLPIEEKVQRRRVLIKLNRQLHDFDDNVREAALEAINNFADGRPLPDYRWIPLRTRQARRRHLYAALHWAILLTGVVIVALGLSYLDTETPLMQVITVLGGLISIAAGLAQIVGKALRNPWENRDQQ